LRYYVKDGGGREKGPLGWYEIRRRVRADKLPRGARVREEGTDAWFPLADLVEREESRARAEVEDAMHDARRRSNGLLVQGTVLLVAGIVATLGSLLFAFFGGFGLVFIGLIVGGVTQISRGLRVRP
jgi:GYF domain 2